MSVSLSDIKKGCADAVIEASTRYQPDKIKAYKIAIENESEENAKWLLEMMLENALIANEKKLPLCDDTGIPYVLIEIGEKADVDGTPADLIAVAEEGIAEGLRRLPGRPMAVMGNDFERITQEKGLYEDSGMVLTAPVRFGRIPGDKVRIILLLQGGGPEIRSKTFRIFHHHSMDIFTKEVASWAVEMAGQLGCTPCVPSLGVGRTHYEATCMMMDAMCHGNFGEETEFEATITKAVNDSFTGPLGVGGSMTALRSFAKIGPQRASGIRVACLRVGCMVDPRRAIVEL